MANNFDDYSELLKKYAEQKSDNGSSAKSETTPKAPMAKKEQSGTGAPRVRKYSPPPVADSSREKNTYKGGVYFSNPPKNIDKEAQRQRNATNGEQPTRQRNVAKGEQPPRTRRVPNAEAAAKTGGKKRKKRRGLVGFFTSPGFRRFVICIVVIAIVSITLCTYGLGCINDVLSLDIKEPKSVEVTIQSGVTDEEVLDILKEKELINNKLFCKLFVKIFSQDGDYIGGSYTLRTDMGVEKMLATMKTDFRGNETVTLTFPEGWTIDKIAEKLEVNKVCTASSFISTLQDVDFAAEYDFIAAIPDIDSRYYALEGYIYPDTYDFYVGENASSVVRRFLDNFESKWLPEYQEQADTLGITVDEAIIMASILQKEAANIEQMPTIAGILYNRVENPSAFPLLQCDSTSDYYKNVIEAKLTSSVADTQMGESYKKLYDTYNEACIGFPVGPICNPGNAAILASLKPDDTGYWYFRHDKEGGIYYAYTLDEHEENGRKAALVGE